MKGLKVFGNENALRIFSLMLGLGAWEIASRLSNTPLVPGPQRVLTTLVRAFSTEGIPNDPTQALGGALLSALSRCLLPTSLQPLQGSLLAS